MAPNDLTWRARCCYCHCSALSGGSGDDDTAATTATAAIDILSSLFFVTNIIR